MSVGRMLPEANWLASPSHVSVFERHWERCCISPCTCPAPPPFVRGRAQRKGLWGSPLSTLWSLLMFTSFSILVIFIYLFKTKKIILKDRSVSETVPSLRVSLGTISFASRLTLLSLLPGSGEDAGCFEAVDLLLTRITLHLQMNKKRSTV